MEANLAASPWYAAGLRSFARALDGLAARLEQPRAAARAEPRLPHFSADEYLKDVRHRVAAGAHRLSRYY